MKKILLIAALFFSFQLSNAQGNLQFNKVINMQIQTSGEFDTGGSGSLKEFGSFTVPDGKIWKVMIKGTVHYANGGTRQSMSSSILSKSSNDSHYFEVYNWENYAGGGDSSTLYYSSGTYGLFISSWSDDYIRQASINGIEYNVLTE